MNGHGSPNFMRALSDFRHFFCCGCYCCCRSLVCEFIIVWTFVAKRRSSGKAHAQQQHRAKNEIFSGFLCENKCLATISDMPHEPTNESARSQFISALYYSWMVVAAGTCQKCPNYCGPKMPSPSSMPMPIPSGSIICVPVLCHERM